MGLSFDFGFEQKGAPWDKAKLALFFACQGKVEDIGNKPGPLAVADGSRFVELFEMQVGVSPLDVGTYAEIVGGIDPLTLAIQRAGAARAKGMLPVIVAEDRRATKGSGEAALVALWGKVGRKEADETAILSGRSTILAGVRAATSHAFQTIPGNVTIITARGMGGEQQMFRQALDTCLEPVHLSIDLDVLAPSAAQTPRSIEPGGLSWYDLMDALELVFAGPGVLAVDLVGTAQVSPRTPASLSSAQILLKLAGLLAGNLK
jgi:agmatinase